jgi:O-antigen/teichoic acid export membrane protein
MISAISRNFAAQGLGLLISFADRVLVLGLLLRAWGPQIYSEWVVLLSYAGLLALGEFGLNAYYGNVWQQVSATGDTERFRRMVSVALYCSATVAAVLGLLALALLVSLDLPTILSIKSLSRTDAMMVLVLIGAAVLSRIVRGAVSQIYRGRQAFALGTMIDLVFPGGTVILTIAAALLGAGPVILAGIYFACDLIAGWCVMLWDLSRRWPDLHFRPSLPTGTEVRQITRHVKWLAVQQAGPVAWLQIPVILLGQAGVTGSALISFVILRTLVNFARSLGTFLSIGAGVEIAHVHHAGRTEDATRHLVTVGGVLSVLTAAIAVGVALLGAPFVTLWTGRPDLFDPYIAAWLLAAAAIAAPTVPLVWHLILVNAPRPASIALLAQLTIGLSACWVLVPQYGAPGAAAGLAVGEVFAMGAVLPAMAARHIRINYLRYLGRCVIGMTLTALWCGAVAMALLTVVNVTSIFGLGIAGGLWGLCGLLPALIATLPARQRAVIVRTKLIRAESSQQPVPPDIAAYLRPRVVKVHFRGRTR